MACVDVDATSLQRCVSSGNSTEIHKTVIRAGPEVIQLFFTRSTQLSMKVQTLISTIISSNSPFSGSGEPRMLFILLINVKMPTIVGILTLMSRKNFMLS